MAVKENIESIKNYLKEANASEVKVVAVSKYASNEQIKEAYNAGLRCFAENYVMPALQKKEELASHFKEKVEWHLIGHLQKNKVKKAVGNFAVIESVDSLELAQLIGKEAAKKNLIQKIYAQINLTGEEKKSGFALKDFEVHYSELIKIPNLDLCGLMTIGPTSNQEFFEKYGKKPETIFEELRLLSSRLVSKKTLELSMGMSSDYKVAIQNGATVVRLGRAIFG